MNITSITSFLVSPGKTKDDPPDVHGTIIPLAGDLYEMLRKLFIQAEKECELPIRFTPSLDGSDQNDARDLIIEYSQHPNLEFGMIIAERLRSYTYKRSGLGLLFIILGRNNGTYKIVFSRFPADTGILAEPIEDSLQVEFIEKIFMKSTTRYKAALYKGDSFDADFWSGYAVDKQVYGTADYWVREFLASDLETTSKFGTRRFTVALRAASNKADDLNVKQEIVGLSMLAKGLSGKPVSINSIMDTFNISSMAKEEIITQLRYEGLADDVFLFDDTEFLKNAPYASVELKNSGILLAPPDRFNDCFSREAINEAEKLYRFETTSQIVDERVWGR